MSVAAEDRDVRTRIIQALSLSDLRLRGTASARELDLATAAPELVIVHCEPVGGDELALLRELKREHVELELVVICRSDNGRNARRAVDAGAAGVVFTERIETALAPTVAAVLAGQTAVPNQLRAGIRRTSLSFREKQILGMVVMGLTNSQIGSRLYLAESTVKSHLSSAYTKLGVRSRKDAATLILDPGRGLGPGILAISAA